MFERTPKYNLTKTFYIQIQAWQESSYSLSYFTSNEKGQIGTQKLLVGQKQKGVIRMNKELPQLNQTSLTYHFSVASKMLQSGAEVEIRLHAGHGEFVYMVAAGRIPDLENDTVRKGVWVGDENKKVVVKVQDLDEETQELVKGDLDRQINFYIRVYPHVGAGQSTDKIAWTFDIAFYDEEKIVQLTDGHPLRGVVNQQTDYYFVDFPDATDYELTLTPISGGDPDLVISLDPKNKYPTK